MRTLYVANDIPRALAVKALKPLWKGAPLSAISPSRFAEIPDPPLPGPRWIRVANRACGICASDVSLLELAIDPSVSMLALPDRPRVYLGHEVVSEVVEVGPEVTRLAVGDRVVMDTRFQCPTCASQEIEPTCVHCAEGNFARCERAAAGEAPHGVGGGFGDGYVAHESEVYRVPEELSDEQAMMVEPISTAVRAVLRRPPARGERALVIGCGITGLDIVQVLRALCPGVHVTAVARHPQQVEAARRLGADEVIGGDLYAEGARITGAQLCEGMFGNRTLVGGFERVYDCVGSAATLKDSLRLARAGGTVVMVGIKMEPLKLDLNPIWHQEVDLIGLFAHGAEMHGGERRHTYDIVIERLLAGDLTTSGLVTHRFPLDRWREALATFADKRSGAIKVAFDLTVPG